MMANENNFVDPLDRDGESTYHRLHEQTMCEKCGVINGHTAGCPTWNEESDKCPSNV